MAMDEYESAETILRAFKEREETELAIKSLEQAMKLFQDNKLPKVSFVISTCWEDAVALVDPSVARPFYEQTLFNAKRRLERLNAKIAHAAKVIAGAQDDYLGPLDAWGADLSREMEKCRKGE